MTVLNEDPFGTRDYPPGTSAADATEGHGILPGRSNTYVFDDPAAPRTAQRLVSVISAAGFDNVLPDGNNTNLGAAGGDVARKELVLAHRRLRRVHDILGINRIDQTLSTFAASGQTITNGAFDARSLFVGRAIQPGVDLAYCDQGGKSDITAIKSVSFTDGGATLDTVTPLDPSAWSNVTVILSPDTHGTYPVMREDRTHYTERVDTGWVLKSQFQTPYTFSALPIAYPIAWVRSGFAIRFQGTFRVQGAKNNVGTGAIDLTTEVLGVTPETGYVYPNFPSPTAPLQLTNVPSATLDLSTVTVPDSVTHIKIDFCRQIADEGVPDANSISPTQTTCIHNIRPPSNHPIANYSGAGDILEVWQNGFFCAKYNLLTLGEWDAYTGPCNNSSCSQYEIWESGYIPMPDDFTDFWMGLGEYFEQSTLGIPDVTFSRVNFDGILTLLGWPVYNKAGLYLLGRTYLNHARFLDNTGEVDAATGYNIFRNWAESVAEGGMYLHRIQKVNLIGANRCSRFDSNPAGVPT